MPKKRKSKLRIGGDGPEALKKLFGTPAKAIAKRKLRGHNEVPGLPRGRKEKKRRRKTAEPKSGPKGYDQAVAEIVTEDGMTWRDPNGKPPVTDKDGKLQQPFVLTLLFGDGSERGRETWMPPAKLPLTPKAHALWADSVEAERNKKNRGRHRDDSEVRDEPTPVTVSGKRLRKVRARSDEGLTEEQKAKRDKRRARREVRKKRRLASGGSK